MYLKKKNGWGILPVDSLDVSIIPQLVEAGMLNKIYHFITYCLHKTTKKLWIVSKEWYWSSSVS